MDGKIKFKSSSTTSNFSFYLGNISCLVLIGYLSLHFNENPRVIGALMLITAAVICVNSRQTCVVMDDRFKILYKRFIPAFSSSKDFLYTEIDSIEAILPLTRTTETGILASLYWSRHPYGKTLENTLTIHYYDGHTKHLWVKISREDLQEAFIHIKKLSPIRIDESY